jgi:hypothetical protein
VLPDNLPAGFEVPVVVDNQASPNSVKYVSKPTSEHPNGAIIVGRAVDLFALRFDLALDADDRAFLEAIKVMM